jgi:hypothetical protein
MHLIIKERPGPWFIGLWGSTMCECMPNGPILEYIKSIDSSKRCAIPWSDGFLYNSDTSNNKGEFTGYEEDVILCVQATRISSLNHGIPNKLLCIPLDDETFRIGLQKVLEKRIPNLYLPWNEKKDIVFWRGAGPHAIRQQVIDELFDYKHADVLYGRIPGNTPEQYTQKYWDPTYEGKWQPIEMSEFVKHKYLLIIDNFIITGAYQWIFGSGSVPILICHPLTDFWFKKYLIPFVNYVPVTHPSVGKCNIREVINFLREHDDIAQNIAINARNLAFKIFSPEFQREYLNENLK